MSLSISEVNALIRTRRAVFPQMYNQEPITDEEIWQILENANWAPTHKKTEPWRFIVFRGEALKTLGDWLAAGYRKQAMQDGDFTEAKQEKFRMRPRQSACVMGICMQRDPGKRLPKWEEIAAVACAVQNMWLTSSAMGIGAYWSTPNFVVDAKDFPNLPESWKCKGLFYMGRWDQQELPASRKSLDEKVVWVTGK